MAVLNKIQLFFFMFASFLVKKIMRLSFIKLHKSRSSKYDDVTSSKTDFRKKRKRMSAAWLDLAWVLGSKFGPDFLFLKADSRSSLWKQTSQFQLCLNQCWFSVYLLVFQKRHFLLRNAILLIIKSNLKLAKLAKKLLS